MSTDLLDELAALGRALDDATTAIGITEIRGQGRARERASLRATATDEDAPSYVMPAPPNRRVRRHRLAPALAAALLVVAGLALASRSARSRPTGPSSSESPTSARGVTTPTTSTSAPSTPVGVAAPATAAATTAAPAPPLFDGAPRPLDVQMVDPDGTLARSGILSLAAGPRGFVATGMGFERSTNPGRLWFSPDGRRWTEPATGTFGNLDVGPVVATPSWYLVQASTRGATEFESGTPRAYRSADGVTWEQVPDSGVAGLSVAVGSQFVRTTATDPETSDDAATWHPVDNPDLQGVTITSASAFGGRVYAIGLPSAGGPVLQAFNGTSVADLRPTVATTGGNVGPLAALPGGVVSVANDLGTCLPNTDVILGPGAAVEPRCGRRQIVRYLPTGGSEWRMLTDQGPVTDDLWVPVYSFGEQLVQFVTGPDRHLTVARSTDGVTWAGVPDVDIDLLGGLDARDAGSPDIVLVAARGAVIVAIVPIPNPPGAIGKAARLVVGTLGG